jgi:truncated hemoglobin YjbI
LRRFELLVDIYYQQVQKRQVLLPLMHSNFCKNSHKTAHV